MAKEIHLFAKKKDAYPTKTTINFYIKEDKTTVPSTIMLYVLFFAVCLLGLVKILVYDMTVELNDVKADYEKKQAVLENYLEDLQDYDAVNSDYNRYSYSYLTENDMIQDRMDVLDMLEETAFAQSVVQSVVVSDNVISVNITDIDLEGTAQLAKSIEGYDMVESVTVNTASYGGTYTSRMVITLKPEGEAGGEQ